MEIRIVCCSIFRQRLSSEKSPLQWLVFLFSFCHTTDLIVYVPLFSRLYSVFGEPSGHGFESLLQPEIFEQLHKRTRLKGRLGTVPFFRRCATFSNFFSFKGSHLQFFLIFCSKLKYQRVSPFKYFGTMRLFKFLIFRFFFSESFSVSDRGDFSFLIFCNKLDFQKPEVSPLLQVYKLCVF